MSSPVLAPIRKVEDEATGFFHGLFGRPTEPPGSGSSPTQPPQVSGYQHLSPSEEKQIENWAKLKAGETSEGLETQDITKKKQDMYKKFLGAVDDLTKNPPTDEREYERRLTELEVMAAAAEGKVPARTRGSIASMSLKKLDTITGDKIPAGVQFDMEGQPIDRSDAVSYGRYSDPYQNYGYMRREAPIQVADIRRVLWANDILSNPSKHTKDQIATANHVIAVAKLQEQPTEHIQGIVTMDAQGRPTVDIAKTPSKGAGKTTIEHTGELKPDKSVAEAKKDLELVKLRQKDLETTSKLKTNASDLAFLENFMQLAFGQSPKGIRGSPAWFTQMKAIVGESFWDRWQGEVNTLTGHGLLSDSAREEALGTARQEAKNRIESDQGIIDAALKPVQPPGSTPPGAEDPVQKLLKKRGHIK